MIDYPSCPICDRIVGISKVSDDITTAYYCETCKRYFTEKQSDEAVERIRRYYDTTRE